MPKCVYDVRLVLMSTTKLGRARWLFEREIGMVGSYFFGSAMYVRVKIQGGE